MIKRDNIRITITIARTLNAELKKEAEYQCISVSKLVKLIILNYLKNKGNISL